MRNVSISGCGAVTSIGGNVEECWEGLLGGRSGQRPVTVIDAVGHRNKFGCEISSIPQVERFAEQYVQLGRTTRIALPAIEEALWQAGLCAEQLAACRVGIAVGTTMGEIEPLEHCLRGGAATVMHGGPAAIADNVRRLYKLNGPYWTITNACAAGNFAIARAVVDLLKDRADIMIVCGVDALSWVAFTGFGSLRAMAQERCSPFDAARDGLLLGEGAGVIILETREHQLKRGARGLASVSGVGFSCDAYHITRPDPRASGAVRAMADALRLAGLDKEDIDFVSAHGTGTPANDRMEAAALHNFFGDYRNFAVNSIKGHIGHTLGAASVIEAVMCVKSIATGIIPHTNHLRSIDPCCGTLNVVKDAPLQADVRYALSNAYAFGGINSSIVIQAI